MIMVTGASGQIGGLVVQHLLDMNTPVWAFVRDKDAFSSVQHPLLEVATGTFEDKNSIEKAMEGVDKVFLIARDNPNQVAQHKNVIDIAEKCGVEHIVKLSAFGASGNSPIALMRWHAETEEQLKKSSIHWTFLRPFLFMQNLLRFRDEVAANSTFSAPMGYDTFALVDIRDIAEVAAHVLKDDGHTSKVYTLTGSDAITYNDIADCLSHILNRSIQYHPVSQESFYQKLLEEEKPSWRAYDLAYIADAYPNDKKSTITKDVSLLLNRSPRGIETFLKDYFW